MNNSMIRISLLIGLGCLTNSQISSTPPQRQEEHHLGVHQVAEGATHKNKAQHAGGANAIKKGDTKHKKGDAQHEVTPQNNNEAQQIGRASCRERVCQYV